MATKPTTARTFDWNTAAQEMVADMRAAAAKQADRSETVSEGLRRAAARSAGRHSTKNYGTRYGARKWASLW